MIIRKGILPLLLTAILIVPVFPAMAMTEEVSPSDAELQEIMTTKVGAVDDQARMQEILDEIAAEQEELLAAQDESSGKPENGRKDGSALENVTDWCSYTLAPNDDGDETYTLTIGNGSAGSTAIFTSGVDELWNASTDDTPGISDHITRISVQEGVDTVGSYCFYYYTALQQVHLPSTLKTIENHAFKNCVCLQNIDIPSSVTQIGESALADTCTTPSTVTIPFSCSKLKKAKMFYDVKYDLAVSPDAPEGTTYITQFEESYNKITEVMAGLDIGSESSDIEKVKAIYDWVTQNVEYDYYALENSAANERRYHYSATAHSALFSHLAICSGYVDLTKTMLKEAGVRCVECDGGDHAWLIIELGGKWYAADPTWDAGLEDLGYIFFLRGFGLFKGHTWELPYGFIYQISDSDYGRFSYNGFEVLAYVDFAVLYSYSGSESAVTLPETVEYNGVAFPVRIVARDVLSDNNSIRKLVIPEGYEMIYENAFSDCRNLTEVTIPTTVKFIAEGVFCGIGNNAVVIYNGTKEQLMESGVFARICNAIGMEHIRCSDGIFINPYNMDKVKVAVSPKKLVYNGKVQQPNINVYGADGKLLVKDVDYEMYYDNGEYDKAKNVDLYEIDIEGLGNYNGLIMGADTFYIVPQAANIKTVKGARKSLKVTWTKKTAQVKGYQIQYALNKKFTKGKKTVTIKSNKTTSRTIKKLKSKKKYYVRIRTYKYGPYYGGNLYSAWSKVKSVKVK